GEEGVPAPAEFEVSNLTVTPSQVGPRESVSVSIEVQNVGDLSGDHKVELRVDENVEDSQTVTLEGGETTTVSFTIQRETKKSYSVSIGDLTQSFEVVTPAEFEVSNFTLNPEEPVVGEEFTASIDVKNVGELEGTYKAVWKVEGEVDDTHEVTLDPGETRSVTFSMIWNEAGTYNVSIGELEKNIEVKPVLKIIEHQKVAVEPYVRVWISGMLRNNSDNPLQPSVQVKYYDKEGYVIDTDSLSYSKIIPPKSEFPFRTRRIRVDDVEEIANYEIDASYQFYPNLNYLDDFTIIEDSRINNEVEVGFKNNSSEIADSVYLQVAFYNKQGEMLGVGVEVDPDTSAIGVPTKRNILPGEKRKLRLSFTYEEKREFSEYKLFISAWS
ncbi:hypothetical protein AKJ58_00300, partial [candidate division MSBL1 archaeon SCGC-AAA385D11]